jgi:tetrahydromethanopterin S-methyltransferase subunit F
MREKLRRKTAASEHGIDPAVNAIQLAAGFARSHSPRNGTLAHKEEGMTIGTILIIILVLVLIGALPTWGYSRSWGYRPTGGIGLVLLIVVILLLLGYI